MLLKHGTMHHGGSAFDGRLAAHELPPLTRRAVRTLQVNMGKRCNQACRHCHVDAGPTRTEQMSAETVGALLELLARSPSVECVDRACPC